jgi:hypothetical protein
MASRRLRQSLPRLSQRLKSLVRGLPKGHLTEPTNKHSYNNILPHVTLLRIITSNIIINMLMQIGWMHIQMQVTQVPVIHMFEYVSAS